MNWPRGRHIGYTQLVTRMRDKKELRAPDFATFYTPGPKGYNDYPVAT